MTGIRLIDQAEGDDIIGRDTAVFVEAVVFIQQVNFIIHIGGHIFVEVVGHAHVDILDQILVAVARIA